MTFFAAKPVLALMFLALLPVSALAGSADLQPASPGAQADLLFAAVGDDTLGDVVDGDRLKADCGITLADVPVPRQVVEGQVVEALVMRPPEAVPCQSGNGESSQ